LELKRIHHILAHAPLIVIPIRLLFHHRFPASYFTVDVPAVTHVAP